MTIKLINEDCMNYMSTLPDKAFDLAIVDPPYGRGQHGGVNRSGYVKQKNGKYLRCMDGGYAKMDWDNEPPPLEYFKELERVTKNRIIFGINYHPVKLQGGVIVWDKVNDGSVQSGAELAHCSLNDRVDMVRYMWRGMMQGESIKNGTRQQGNKKLNEKRIHPTQKPVKIYEWLLNQYAKPGQSILDTHLGSGSIAIAAYNLGFDFVGCEINKEYFDAARNRLNDYWAEGAT